MPLNINQMSSDITVSEGDLPLSPQQIEQLMQIILQRLEEKQLDNRRSEEATRIRSQATPTMYLGEGN